MQPLNYSDAETGDAIHDAELEAWRECCNKMAAQEAAKWRRYSLARKAALASWPVLVFFAGISAPE